MITVLSIIHAPAFGGLHALAMRLRRPLLELGVDLRVVVPSDARDVAARLLAHDVPHYVVPLSRLRKSIDPRIHGKFLSSLRSEVRELSHLATAERAQVIASSGVQHFHGLLASRRAKTPYVIQINSSLAPAPLRLASYFHGRSAVTALVEGSKLMPKYPGLRYSHVPFQLFYPGIDLDSFQRTTARTLAARRKLSVDTDQILVGTLGNRVHQKGHEFFLRAADSLVDEFPNVRFVIFGAAVESNANYYARAVLNSPEVRRLCELERLEIRDPLEDANLLLPALDVFVLSSRAEGVATATLEAMASECPVVAFDVGSVSDAVIPGKTGFLAIPGNTQSLARSIRELVLNADLRQSLAGGARAEAESRFGIQRCAEIYAQAYSTAAKDQPE